MRMATRMLSGVSVAKRMFEGDECTLHASLENTGENSLVSSD